MAAFIFHGNLNALKTALHSDVRAERMAAIVAMNKCLQQVANKGSTELSKKIRLPRRAIKSRVKIIKANDRTRKYAAVVTLNQPFPIDRLGPRELARGGYSAAGRKYPHAFRAFQRTGTAAQQRLIFERRGKARLPIDRVGIPIQDEADAVFKPLFDKFTREKLPALFDHEMRRRIDAR